MKIAMQRAALPALCILCAIAAGRSSGELTGTEAIGGVVTGPVIACSVIAALLLLADAFLALAAPRLASLVALGACAICLPAYIYRVLPRLFRAIFPGLYKAPSAQIFVWHGWSVAGISISFVLAYVCYTNITRGDAHAKG